MLGVLARPTERARPPFAIEGFTGRVTRVSEEARAAGLGAGDRVIAIDGRACEGHATVGLALEEADPGDMMVLDVEKAAGERVQVAIRLAPPEPWRADQAAVVIAIGLVTPLLCLLLGFAVAFVRPLDLRAWLLLLLMLSFSQLAWVDEGQPATWDSPLRVPAILYRELMGTAWPVWMLLFGLHFPDRLELDRRRPWIKWLLLAPVAFDAVNDAIVAGGAAQGWDWARPLWDLRRALGNTTRVVGIMAVAVFFASIGYRRGVAASPDALRRLRLLMWGSQLSLSPLFVLVLGALFTGRHPLSFPAWLTVPALLALVLFPLTLAYVIVVHQAMDVRVVVRQGLQHALARRGVIALQVLVSVAALLVATSLAGEAARASVRAAVIVLGIGLVFGMGRVADRLRAWVDRRFFREAYDAERVLAELAESVRTMVETEPMLRTVAERISDTLHVPRVTALVRQDGAFVPALALGYGARPDVRVPEASPLVQRLAEGRRALRLRPDDGDGRGREDGGTLRALGAQLVLPLATKDRVLGMLVLGPKLSEEPYSPSDVRMLQAVAAQTALALENGQLTAAIAEEVAQRARLNREIEIARQVQEGLFPQHYPRVEGIDYVGWCRPARGVGGDYYDFVRVSDGLGIAIGDISGKGIPAALLMACLQASLRAQAAFGPRDLATLMARLNVLIYDASPPNRYATFFYGTYESARRRLRYVNAGHNAPVLLRADGSVARIDAGGPVIGLLPEAAYEEGVSPLGPDDLLVAFTDGISEAMNAAGDEWGEERLLEAVRRAAGRSPREVLEAVVAAADAFVAGAPQNDDMTLVVIRGT